MSDAKATAMDLQFEAMLGEALGHGPPDDLAARIAARLRDARPALAWRFAAAALLLLGAAVVCAVWWVQERDRARAAAPPVPPPQEPAPSKPLDAATAARVAALLKDLELPERRKEATFALGEIGPVAAPLLDQALAAGATRARPDVLAAIGL